MTRAGRRSRPTSPEAPGGRSTRDYAATAGLSVKAPIGVWFHVLDASTLVRAPSPVVTLHRCVVDL